MSDDSHGTDQVGTNYPRLLQFMKMVGIDEVFYVDRDAPPSDSRFAAGFSSITVADLSELPFWRKIR